MQQTKQRTMRRPMQQIKQQAMRQLKQQAMRQAMRQIKQQAMRWMMHELGWTMHMTSHSASGRRMCTYLSMVVMLAITKMRARCAQEEASR